MRDNVMNLLDKRGFVGGLSQTKVAELTHGIVGAAGKAHGLKAQVARHPLCS